VWKWLQAIIYFCKQQIIVEILAIAHVVRRASFLGGVSSPFLSQELSYEQTLVQTCQIDALVAVLNICV